MPLTGFLLKTMLKELSNTSNYKQFSTWGSISKIQSHCLGLKVCTSMPNPHFSFILVKGHTVKV